MAILLTFQVAVTKCLFSLHLMGQRQEQGSLLTYTPMKEIVRNLEKLDSALMRSPVMLTMDIVNRTINVVVISNVDSTIVPLNLVFRMVQIAALVDWHGVMNL